MKALKENTVRNEGWGADREFSSRPAVPMEKPSAVRTVRGKRPVQQKTDVRIFVSTEHPDITPVFGTTCPPRGLSGKLREIAYRSSEGRLRHWFTLMLADRVDVAEGLLGDIVHLRLPNLIRERGWLAEFRYGDARRRRRATLIAAGAAGVLGMATVYLARAATRRART